MVLRVGQKAPDFTLTDQNGKQHTLSSYLGKRVLLYFYPADNTPGCTKEACGFRDKSLQAEEKNLVILGVSKDTVESHKNFSGKYSLTFPLLSDTDKKVIGMYGAYGLKKMMGKEYMGILRISFLINPKGEIEKIYKKVKTDSHADEVLSDLA